MAALQEAFGPTEKHPWEAKENQQKYTYLATEYISPTPKRHILGIVGGNEVSVAEGNVVDVESDLRGINIPNTFAPWRQYQPPPKNQREIKRDNTKIKLDIDVSPMHLPAYQMWAYPGMPTPAPIKNEVCKNPEKY
jgi:hypothetical protein